MSLSKLVIKNQKDAEQELQDAIADNRKSTDTLFPLTFLRDRILGNKSWRKIFGRKKISEDKK